MDRYQFRQIRKGAKLSTRALAATLRITDERTISRAEVGERPVSGPVSILMEMIERGELPARYLAAASERIK